MTQAQIDALKVFFLEQLPSGEGVVNALRIRTSLENFLDTLGIVADVELINGKLYVNGVEFAGGGGTPFTTITSNQYGTHPAFASQHELNVWLLTNTYTK